MSSKIKKIELETKDIKTLVKLLDRGLGYTDSYYKDYKRMSSVWDKVITQLKEQGAKSVFNGEIKF